MNAENSNYNVEVASHTTMDTFVRGGGTKRVTRIVYFVGKFGPYTEDFDPGHDDAPTIQAKIAQKVQVLRALNNATY